MPAIRRSCANRVPGRVLKAGDQPLLALLLPGAGDCKVCGDAQQLQARLLAEPQAIIVYNQHADAIAQVDCLEVGLARVFIEIRRDTSGVLGLQAYRKPGRATEPLELLGE